MTARAVKKILIILSLPATMLLSLTLGRYYIPPSKVLLTVFNAVVSLGHPSSPTSIPWVIVVLYRAPRIVAAVLIGVALSISGASLQSMLRTPLVDTYILGVTSGAAFGAALAIAFLPPEVPVEVLAMISAMMAFALVLSISWGWGRGSVIALVLSGIIINALFSALLSLAQFLTPNIHRLASITFWLMGDIGRAAFWWKVSRMVLIIVPCTVIMLLSRWRLNLLSLGDDEARSLGVRPGFERALYSIICAVMTASAVSYAGIIGWVGLLVPNMVRLLIGSDNRDVITYSAVLGGTYMLLADDLSRCLTSQEIPIGILTTVMGAPLFIYLLRRAGRVWR